VYVTVAMLTHHRNRKTLLDEFESSEIYGLVRDLPKRSTPELWDGHRSVSVTHRDDPFSECDSSAESDTSCSMDDRSRAFTSLENALQSIKQVSHADEKDANEEEASSTATSASDDCANIVPFQEIIDLALAYMEQVPPAQIESLASSYYRPEEIQNYVAQAHKISMFSLPEVKQDWNQYRSLESLAIVAIGCGHLVDKKRFLKLRLKVRSFELAAFSVFLFTLASVLQNLCVPASDTLWGAMETAVTMASNNQHAYLAEMDLGPNVSKPSTSPLCLEQSIPSSAPHMTELTDMLSSASRIVMENSVSIYVRTHTSEIAAATWNATTNAVMRGLESEPLLDLDVIEPDGSHASTEPSTTMPHDRRNNTSLCLSNLSWATALLSSQGSMSIVYCLSAAAANEGRA
jgi:hypothetical protein